MTSFDTDRFIIEIQRRPALWDSRCADYGSRMIKAKAWADICENFFDNFQEMDSGNKYKAAVELQRKWKSLRNSFRRELAISKKLKSGSAADTGRKEYMYFQKLSFLLPICHDTKSQTEGASDSDCCAQQDSNPEIAAGPSRPVHQTRKRKSTSSSSSSSEDLLLQTLAKNIERKIKGPEDADRHFLLSLLPHFKSISDNMKLELQGEFLAVLSKYRQRTVSARQQFSPTPTEVSDPSSAP
ncbi:uncharacterized protein LOC101863378 [Aplysia californica]|uniref:Uncharacterized protein LOC101863378 n=1 Tax=Aplysia californica TaxID=6500 RepID=A0ABM0K4P6_APLCA|nr:uncharacterized protein LOC101863378 [Aplysia californica]